MAHASSVFAARRAPFNPRRLARRVVFYALVVLVCAAILARIDVGYPLARPLQLVLAALGAAAAVIALWRTWASRAPSARIPE